MCQAVDIVVARGDMVTPILKQVLNDNTASQGVNDIQYYYWLYIFQSHHAELPLSMSGN